MSGTTLINVAFATSTFQGNAAHFQPIRRLQVAPSRQPSFWERHCFLAQIALFFFFFLSICNDTPWRPFLKGCSPFSRFSQQKKKKTLLQHKVVCVFIKRKNLSTVCHKSPIVSCVFIPLSFSLFRSLAATAKRNLREIERCCTTKMRELFLRTTATQKRDMRLRQSTEIIIKKKEDMCRARPA